MFRILILTFIVLALSGCSRDSKEAAAFDPEYFHSTTQEKQRAKNKYLAYSHKLTVTVERSNLSVVFNKVLDACIEDSETACLVMHSEQSGGDYAYGSIRLRVAPEGISKYKSLVSESGKIEQQSTSAEDLTDSVFDTEKRFEMLKSYQSKLEELEKAPNINIESLIRVASELSEVQTQLEYTQGQKAKLYQRINMEVLNISLDTQKNENFISPIKEALSGFGEDFSEGIAIFITVTAYLIPWLLIVILLVWFMRHLWIRSKRRADS